MLGLFKSISDAETIQKESSDLIKKMTPVGEAIKEEVDIIKGGNVILIWYTNGSFQTLIADESIYLKYFDIAIKENKRWIHATTIDGRIANINTTNIKRLDFIPCTRT